MYIYIYNTNYIYIIHIYIYTPNISPVYPSNTHHYEPIINLGGCGGQRLARHGQCLSGRSNGAGGVVQCHLSDGNLTGGAVEKP